MNRPDLLVSFDAHGVVDVVDPYLLNAVAGGVTAQVRADTDLRNTPRAARG